MKSAAVFTLAVLAMFAIAGGAVPFHVPLAPQAAQAQGADLKMQLKTAVTHAGFASGGQSLAYVQQHLGHALNCIAGAKGPNFNPSWGHVCQGQGNGILVDLGSAPGGAAFRLVVQQADTLAAAGVKSKDLAEMKNVARGVAALLTVVVDQLK